MMSNISSKVFTLYCFDPDSRSTLQKLTSLAGIDCSILFGLSLRLVITRYDLSVWPLQLVLIVSHQVVEKHPDFKPGGHLDTDKPCRGGESHPYLSHFSRFLSPIPDSANRH